MPHVAVPDPAAAATVRFLLADGSRAMVQLDGGGTAAVVRERVTPLVPLDRVLRVGMRIDGSLEPSGTELLVAFETPSPSVLAAAFPDGVVTPALVTRTGELGGELALHPDVRVRICRRDVSSNPKDRLDDLLRVGDVVVARVSRHEGDLRLSLIDVDDDEPVVPALRLLPDGPEWLAPPGESAQEVEEPEALSAVVAEPPAGRPAQGRGALRSVQLALDAERAETARLRQELEGGRAVSPVQVRELREDLGRAVQEHRRLGDQLRAANRELTALRRRTKQQAAPSGRDRRERFGDAESWIRHELLLAWIDRYDPCDRAQHPLRADFVLGPAFAASLEQLEDERLDKAFRACVDVLSGRADEIPSRDVHPLRTHESGGAPPVVREDEARCMRCAIENDTPSARRLHWWRLRDGGVELSRVVLHDDMAP